MILRFILCFTWLLIVVMWLGGDVFLIWQKTFLCTILYTNITWNLKKSKEIFFLIFFEKRHVFNFLLIQNFYVIHVIPFVSALSVLYLSTLRVHPDNTEAQGHLIDLNRPPQFAIFLLCLTPLCVSLSSSLLAVWIFILAYIIWQQLWLQFNEF